MRALGLSMLVVGAVTLPILAVPARAGDSPFAAMPAVEDLIRYFPQTALKAQLEGLARIRCKVGGEGGLSDCAVVSETPANLGFGEAALKLAPLFRMKPKSEGGPASDTITLPIRFNLDDPGREIANPRWVSTPDAKTLGLYYPITAADKKIGGRAVVRCAAHADGTLHDCLVMSETPTGENFGDAALKMAQVQFRLAPTAMDGVPVDGGFVTVSINFGAGPTGG